jgi:(1->4)-alpha-D-glucan 1-alpha-D-glucosylmutase
VLSERAAGFEAGLADWRRRVHPADGVTPAEQRFVAQTLLGAWPLHPRDFDEFESRISAYLTKAVREAKSQSSWLAPDETHEAEVIALARRSIADGGRSFKDAFGALLDEVAFYGAVNSLAQLTWKLALPGAVDVYRGTEMWDLSLTDPDNRRPVDFDERRTVLAGAHDDWQSGALKLRMTAAGLRARRDDPDLFVGGEYLPLAVDGARRDHVLAFARRAGGRWAMAVAPRLVAGLTACGVLPVGAVWRDTALVLPTGAPREWNDVYTGALVTSPTLAEILAKYPAALLSASDAA